VQAPPGFDMYYWLDWIMNQVGIDSAAMQSDLLRANRMARHCDYRRFQISLDQIAMGKLPNLSLEEVDETDAAYLHELRDEELASISLDAKKYLGLMKVIGQGMAKFLADHAEESRRPMFSYDPVDAHGRELLVTKAGRVDQIRERLADPSWAAQIAE
jgi:hypothetical protein